MILESITGFLDKYNLPWLLLAVMTWVLIISTCSWKIFRYALPVGLWSMFVGYVMERFFIYHKFWIEKFILVHIGELDLFIVIGPFFAAGIMLIRFLPESGWGNLLSLLAWSLLFTGIEWVAATLKFLDYDDVRWTYIHSYVSYFFSLMNTLGFYYLIYALPVRHKPHPD